MTTQPDLRRPRRSGGIVVKLGGSTLGSHDTSLRDIASAYAEGRKIVVVHGGGAVISEWLARAGLEPTFVRGLRVTDAATLEVVVAVLAGVVNKRLVAELASLGARAAGLSGADGSMLSAEAYDRELGFVGRITGADPRVISDLLKDRYLPVIAPIAVDAASKPPQLLNVNADTSAGEIAATLHAERLVFLTDVEGVLDEKQALIASLTAAESSSLTASGVVSGGMIPKIEAAVRAAEAGCVTNIIDGTKQRALARLLDGERVGTSIVP